MSILTYIAGLPLLAALALVIVPRNYRVPIRAMAVLATFLSATLAVKMFCGFGSAAMDASSRFPGSIPSASAITWAWTA
jgi:hypothetical protein